MKAFYHQLFDYNFYCNRRLIETCAELDTLPGKTGDLFSHILNAHHIWNARILREEPMYKVWEGHEVKAWEEIHYENQRTTFEIITNSDAFERRLDYESTDGRAYSNALGDILFHIVNHSTHHRGQIATEFRNAGLEPIQLDYIFYKR